MSKSFAIFLILFFSVTTNSVFAYHIYEDPILYVEANWINEPVIATEPNGVELLIRNGITGQPISELEDRLVVELIFEGKKTKLHMEEDHKNPGRYVFWIVPMMTGDYSLNVSGESEVSFFNQFKLPTVENISYEQFPLTSGPSKFVPESEKNMPLTETDQSIKNKIQQIMNEDGTNSIIYLAIGLAIIGITVGSYALVRNRNPKK